MRGQKKNWKYNITMTDKEIQYWLDYLKRNEKRGDYLIFLS